MFELEAAATALGNLFEPTRLGWLLLGVAIGLVLGVIPGLNGIMGVAILLPFTFTMDPYTAMALIMGIASVGGISDTIPAVLFAVPGTVGSQATVLDGYPLARKGQAGRALGAAYTSNVLGGLIGAAALIVSAFALQPVVKKIGGPEIFILAVLGISMVGSLSAGAMVRGLAMGFFGLALATIGLGTVSAAERYTFGQLYLWDGLPMAVAAIGFFGIPEVADLAIQRTAIAGSVANVITKPWEGVKDVFRNKGVLIRCSLLGSFFGAVPGIGTLVIDWLAYGHVVQTSKDKDQFGKGDIRGVIAPEAANNAKEGGQAIPSLAFGVPGGLLWALVISALMIQGLRPGPTLFTQRLDLVFTIAWSIALANVFGAAITLALTPFFARISTVKINVLAPAIMALVAIAAFQATSDMGDLVALGFFSLLGWFAKRAGWPRPPLMIGMVLGALVEQQAVSTFSRYGLEVFLRPGFSFFAVIIVALLIWSLRWQQQQQKKTEETHAVQT